MHYWHVKRIPARTTALCGEESRFSLKVFELGAFDSGVSAVGGDDTAIL